MDIFAGDVLIMKKNHPGCGNNKMKVIHIGEELKLSCMGCGHMVLIPRVKCEKKIKSVIHESEIGES